MLISLTFDMANDFWPWLAAPIKAPAISGHPDFERYFRVQANTLEWMPIFLPSLWLFALYVSDMGAAAIGLVW